MTATMHAAPKSAGKSKPGLWSRLREAWQVAGEVEYDWSTSETEAPRPEPKRALPPAPQRHPAPGPAAVPSGDPNARSGGHALPLEVRPAPPTELLKELIGIAADMLPRPVNNRTAVTALQKVMRALSEAAMAEHNIEVRSPRNQAAAAELGRGLTAAASVPGVEIKTTVVTAPDGTEREVIPDAVSQILANAKKASDPRPTGMIPVITDDMPDPRVAGHDPLDEVGAFTPVHAETTGTIPAVPAQRPESDPLPHRDAASDPEGMSPPLPASVVPSHPFLTGDEGDETESAAEVEPEVAK